MKTFTLHLELLDEPSPEVLQEVLKMLGVLKAGAAASEQDELGKVVEIQQHGAEKGSTLPLLFDRAQAAKLLGRSPSTIDRWRRKGLIPCIKHPGTGPMFSRDALIEFVSSHSRLTPQRRTR